MQNTPFEIQDNELTGELLYNSLINASDEKFSGTFFYYNQKGEYEDINIGDITYTAEEIILALKKRGIEIKFVKRKDGSIDIVDNRYHQLEGDILSLPIEVSTRVAELLK
ncbi:hypothetical protein LAT59_03455 [Candidatus Gracilibacteria bacterium]|nr:hypothetical protein [Candidatus Gracilibacteria bacterium]